MEIIGLERGRVVLMPHTELWHELFAVEDLRLRAAVGAHATAVEHVGSTAVCGLAAKPVIDVALAVREIAAVERCVAPLRSLGYEYRGEQGLPGRHFFGKGSPRTHHLHLVELGGGHWRDYLLFRDHLRGSREAAGRYERLKRELAAKHARDREAYTAGKAAFIEEALQTARGGAAGAR